MITISIVIPIYNSEKNISKLVNKIFSIFYNEKIEIVLVNDNSLDNSHKECLEVYDNNTDKITYIKLAKNMGEHNAVMAGLNYSEGEFVIVMDDDFQNPPEEAFKLFNYAKNSSHDVIYSRYKQKEHSFIRNLISKINDKTANLILKKPKNIYLSSFKCIKKKIYNHIIEYKGPSPYIDGLILSATSNIGTFETNHAPRQNGKSGYTLIKLLKLYSNVFTNFSTFPIHLFSITGLIISILGAIFLFFILYEKIANPNIPMGYTSLISIIVFFSGIQIIFLGLLGEYIGKILKKVNNENQFFIDFEKKRKSLN